MGSILCCHLCRPTTHIEKTQETDDLDKSRHQPGSFENIGMSRASNEILQLTSIGNSRVTHE